MSATVIELEKHNVTELSPREIKLQEWQISIEYIKRDALEEGHEDIAYFSDILLSGIKDKQQHIAPT